MRDLLRLFSFLRPYARFTLLSILCGLATIAAGIGLISTSSYLISAAALRPSIATLEVAIVGVRFFGLARGVLRYAERLASHSVNFHLLANLRVRFFKALEPLAPSGLQDDQAGDLLSRSISDIETLQDFYVRAAAPPLVAVLTSVGMAFFIGGYQSKLAWILLLFMGLTGFVLPIIIRWLAAAPSHQMVSIRGKLNAAVVDSIQGLPDLLAFGCEEYQVNKLETLYQEFSQSQLRLAVIQAVQLGLSTLLVNLGGAAVLWIAIPAVNGGQVPGVTLAMLVLGSLAAFEAVQPLPQAAQTLASSRAAAVRLFELIDRPSNLIVPEHIQSIPKPDQGFDLKIKDLQVCYQPGYPCAIKGLSLDLPFGKHIALVGQSGSGKTTLANVLMRFQEYQSGLIYLGDVELKSCDPKQVQEAISLVPQQIYLFNGSLRQNLHLADPTASPNRMEEALHLAQLDSWLKGLESGLDTQIGERGLRLSGGERQRLALAQAILRNTRFWILDEPTANLDSNTEARFMDALSSVIKDRSLIYITHRLAGLDCMDEIYVMQSGQIIEHGSHHDLTQTGGLYQRLWEAQRRIVDP